MITLPAPTNAFLPAPQIHFVVVVIGFLMDVKGLAGSVVRQKASQMLGQQIR